jgi:glycosyltransferase involved in cell wall biosynthesis
MLVSLRSTSDNDVQTIWGSLPWRAADWLARQVTDRLSLQYLFYPSSFGLLRHPWFREADVVQLYNTHGSYFSHTALIEIARRKRVIWRLSDMWPVTGHCAYSFDCDRWKTGCGSCPLLADEPSLHVDRTAFLWKVKKWVYDRSPMTIVASSRWMASIVGDSPLLNRFPLHIIPNGVDLDVFRATPKPVAREALGVRGLAPVVFFSAVELGAARKGGPLLTRALDIMKSRGVELEVLVAGRGGEQWRQNCPYPVTALGSIADDRLMALAYSAADLFVLPTLAENLPNGILESMACGTPAVGFDVGGVPDLVRHGETGHLVRTRDAEGLADAMATLATDADRRVALGRRGREVAEREYSSQLEARRFLDLCQAVA